VETKLTERIAETNERISEVKTELTEKISQVETRLTEKITETAMAFRSDNKAQFKWFIGILVTLFIALATLMLTKGAGDLAKPSLSEMPNP